MIPTHAPASPSKPIFDEDYKKAYQEGHRVGGSDSATAHNPHKQGSSAWFGWADGAYDGRVARKRQFSLAH